MGALFKYLLVGFLIYYLIRKVFGFKVVRMDDDEFYEIAPVNQGTAQMFVNRIRAAKEGQ